MATLQARQQATTWATEQAARPPDRPAAVDWGQVLHLAQYPPLVTTLTVLLTAALVVAGHYWGLAMPLFVGLWALWPERDQLARVKGPPMSKAEKLVVLRFFGAFAALAAVVFILIALFPGPAMRILEALRSLEGM